MTRLWTEGFEAGDLLGWTALALSNSDIRTTPKRSGNAAFVLGGAGGGFDSFSNAMAYYFLLNSQSSSEGYFRFCLYLPSGWPSSGIQAIGTYDWRCYWRNGGTALGSISVNSDRKICIYTGTTLVGTSTKTLNYNQWYIIECHIDISTTGILEARIDGLPDPTLKYYGNCKPGTDTGINNFYWYGSWNGQTKAALDDIAYNDVLGTVDNSWCGDGHIIAITPSTDITHQFIGSDGDSTDNYLLVDEIPTNNDTDYVQSDTIEDKDLYDMTNTGLTDASVRIQRIWIEARAKCAFPRGGTISLLTKPNGGTEFESTPLTLFGIYGQKLLSDSQFVNPATGAAWTCTDIDALQAGVKVKS